MPSLYCYKMAGRPAWPGILFKPSNTIFPLTKFRKNQRSFATMTDTTAQQKTYHKKASGNALITVRKHSKEHDLKLFGSCFW